MIPASRTEAPHGEPGWGGFVAAFAAAAAALVVVLYGFILVLDPYGMRVRPGHPPTALMDLNQRYMYPQLARSGLFDSAIFGTSTMRLIEPRGLGEAFEARVANLGMNAATPWEQVQLADLFLRYVPAPKLAVFGLDRNWCAPDADLPANRITFRSFPPWLYGDNLLAGLPDLLNVKSLEIASRLALNRLGLMPERIRRDGYEVFTPPEASYDVARARGHIYEGRSRSIVPPVQAVTLSEGERQALRFPALVWLDGLVARLPASTRLLLVMPPVHVAVQAQPGSQDAAIDTECKSRIAAIGARHEARHEVRNEARNEARTIDFRLPSPITREDANYWDPLHYRLAIAARVAASLKAASAGESASDGTYQLLP